MTAPPALAALAGILPVLLLLAGLLLMDSFQLVRPDAVAAALICGALAAAASYGVHRALIALTGVGGVAYARLPAPLVEETCKGIWILLLLRGRRIGFAVDAAILGFAVGVGFGLVENVVLLAGRPAAGMAVWILRGCGTAVMHGGATAILAVVAQARTEGGRRLPWLSGLAAAVLIHALFNGALVSSAWAALWPLLVLPPVLALVFVRSEQATARWIGTGFDTTAEMLAILQSGRLSDTPAGAYLRALRRRFPPAVVADMLCLLRLDVELAIQLKGLLLMRRGGFRISVAGDARRRIAEMEHLRRAIGPTGRLALGPLMRPHRKRRWRTALLSEA